MSESKHLFKMALGPARIDYLLNNKESSLTLSRFLERWVPALPSQAGIGGEVCTHVHIQPSASF